MGFDAIKIEKKKKKILLCYVSPKECEGHSFDIKFVLLCLVNRIRRTFKSFKKEIKKKKKKQNQDHHHCPPKFDKQIALELHFVFNQEELVTKFVEIDEMYNRH